MCYTRHKLHNTKRPTRNTKNVELHCRIGNGNEPSLLLHLI